MGVVRLISQYGNIFEGMISADGKMNGFCICYNGYLDLIEVGWYQNNIVHGNWISFNASQMFVKELESGWYQ